jgi:diketogulonate reductase-like aldo/keto reductase
MDIVAFNEIKPAVNQIEVNPFQQQGESIALMRELNVQAEAWAPFAEGRNNLFQNQLLQAIASEHGKTLGQVVLRWVPTDRQLVTPKQGVAVLVRRGVRTRRFEQARRGSWLDRSEPRSAASSGSESMIYAEGKCAA